MNVWMDGRMVETVVYKGYPAKSLNLVIDVSQEVDESVG